MPTRSHREPPRPEPGALTPAAAAAAPSDRTEDEQGPASLRALDVIVGLLSELDTPTPSSAFWNRLCDATCRLTSMRRAVIFNYDDARRRVLALGSHGIELALFRDAIITVESAPIAQRALAEDRVIAVSEHLEDELPAEYLPLLGETTLTCTPMSAAGRQYGVILADRGGGRFALTDEQRHTLWTLGKVAALAVSARIATRHQERARQLADRIDLAREVHESVIQRLFGVSLALSAEHELSPAARVRVRDELQAALHDLRTAVQRPLARQSRETQTTLREELDRLRNEHADLALHVMADEDIAIPAELEPLAQSILTEAVRNARKHAEPTRIEVRLGHVDGAFSLEIRNDGVHGRAQATSGVGLRLAAFEALQHGGVVEFGAHEPDLWRVRLVVPLSG